MTETRTVPIGYTSHEEFWLDTWSQVSALYETIDTLQREQTQEELIYYFVPLLDCYNGVEWRETAEQFCAGEIALEEFSDSSLVKFLYGLDFFTLQNFLDAQNSDHQLLKKAWRQLTAA